eukprot:TRINITY_DN2057_c0_g2_i14.p1 TRINITY_DN2057_c0_g2~~TRINITY_DN2057_c0_g2_i14.p1  ORF type:complete len:105 (+),score=9.81 TRINITY_DN2057_c0_g2_i14:258-572(+)
MTRCRIQTVAFTPSAGGVYTSLTSITVLETLSVAGELREHVRKIQAPVTASPAMTRPACIALDRASLSTLRPKAKAVIARVIAASAPWVAKLELPELPFVERHK